MFALVVFAFGTWLTETYYNLWITPDPQMKPRDQVESIEHAIGLRPLEQEGYNKILDIYLVDGILDEDEHAQFQDLLNRHQERINRKRDLFAPLYRRLAFTYLSSYDVDAEARLQKAYNYLEVVQPFPGATEVEATAINSYLEIEEYYREYIWLEGFLREPTGGEVNDLIRRTTAMLDTMQRASDADRLAYACTLAALMEEHGVKWLDLVEYSKVAGLAAKVEQQLQKEVTDPAAARLKQELTRWKNEVHPWEE